MHLIRFRLGFRPDPAGKARIAPPNSLAVFKDPNSKDGRGKEEGRTGERRERVKEKREGKDKLGKGGERRRAPS